MYNKGEYFQEDETWYVSLVKECLDVISTSNCIVEVNTRGLYKGRSDSLFPGETILKQMMKLGIPATISSDAHKPEEVGIMLDLATQALAEAGYKEVHIFNQDNWDPIPLGEA